MNEDYLQGVPKKELVIDTFKDDDEEDDDEEDGNIENQGRPLQISYPGEYNQGYSSLSLKSDSKKNAGGKRLKPDDEEEDVKIETYLQRDVKSISVKDMRKLVPKLRIECYYTEQELSGKKKMKHLWDQKPSTWPSDVPFKDPNNPGKEGTTKKPGKSDLTKMFLFLREVYLKNKGLPSFISGSHSPVSQTSQQQQKQQQLQQQQHYHFRQNQQDTVAPYFHGFPQQQSRSLPQHFTQDQLPQMNQQFHPVAAYSPNGKLSMEHKIAQPESMDEGQLIPSQVDATAPGMSCSPPSFGDGGINQDPVKDDRFILPEVVQELSARINSKVDKVVRLPGVTQAIRDQLIKVIEGVLHPIYKSLMNTSFCLMYLDAGHQMEALLDCMIVLGKVEANLLSSGCTEIEKKFQNFDMWYCTPNIFHALSHPSSDSSGIKDCIKLRQDGNDFPKVLSSNIMTRILSTYLDMDADNKKEFKNLVQQQALDQQQFVKSAVDEVVEEVQGSCSIYPDSSTYSLNNSSFSPDISSSSFNLLDVSNFSSSGDVELDINDLCNLCSEMEQPQQGVPYFSVSLEEQLNCQTDMDALPGIFFLPNENHSFQHPGGTMDHFGGGMVQPSAPSSVDEWMLNTGTSFLESTSNCERGELDMDTWTTGGATPAFDTGGNNPPIPLSVANMEWDGCEDREERNSKMNKRRKKSSRGT